MKVIVQKNTYGRIQIVVLKLLIPSIEISNLFVG